MRGTTAGTGGSPRVRVSTSDNFSEHTILVSTSSSEKSCKKWMMRDANIGVIIPIIMSSHDAKKGVHRFANANANNTLSNSDWLMITQ